LILIDKLDILSIEAQLNRKLVQAQDQIAQLDDPEEISIMYNSSCYQDTVTGLWMHADIIHAGEDDSHLITCPFKNRQECKRKINHLKLLSLPLLCFRDPEIAAGQRTLQGLAQESCIYRTS
jgi:hypothetical protein